jgi:hypothetical protein
MRLIRLAATALVAWAVLATGALAQSSLARAMAMPDLDRVVEPSALIYVFGLSATYLATRDGAAKAGPVVK